MTFTFYRTFSSSSIYVLALLRFSALSVVIVLWNLDLRHSDPVSVE